MNVWETLVEAWANSGLSLVKAKFLLLQGNIKLK